jgi:hypothetical protein
MVTNLKKADIKKAMIFSSLCDPAGIRTQDPYIKSVLLYQLSYGIISDSNFSDPAGIRTQDPYIKSVLLYQLSYGIKFHFSKCSSQMRMQNYALFSRLQNPIWKIFLLFFLLFTQSIDVKAQNDIAKKADSLFLEKNFSDAAKLYEILFHDTKVHKAHISLKLAYIFENEGNIPKALYYLNSYYNQNPSNEVFDKMNKMAVAGKFTGYERNNINFVFSLYQQFYIFILYALIFLGIFLVVVLYNKRKHGKPIHRNNWMLTLTYMLLLGILINLPSTYRSAIVKEKTYLRDFPSSGAPIIGEIEPGNKINLFGSEDIWQKAYWNRGVAYVNKNDLWLLEE